MFPELEQAIEEKNYDLARTIIKELNDQQADQLWLKYYQSLIIEKQDHLIEAEKNYREIIKDSIYPDPKLINLIRNGIERIVKINKDRKEAKKQVFTNTEDSQNLAVLILEPVTLSQKKDLAPQLAKIMEIDGYTATLQIPTRSWRLYKTGSLGELNYYQSELSNAGIPCFCQPINEISKIIVYQVKYISNNNSHLTLICEHEQGQEQEIKLNWHKINNCVQGIIPLFDLTVNLDARYNIEKKKSTLDYVEFYDLHSTSDNTIFRFSDRSYQFEQDINNYQKGTTTKEKWQDLVDLFAKKIPNQKLWSDFTLFGEGVVQFPKMLQHIKSHIYLFRREESFWDEAFHLYSSLIFQQSLTKL